MEVYSISEQELGTFAEHCKRFLGFLGEFGFMEQPPSRIVHNRIACCEFWGTEVAIQCQWEKAEAYVEIIVAKMDGDGPVRCYRLNESGELVRETIVALFSHLSDKNRAAAFMRENRQLPFLEGQVKYCAAQLEEVVDILASKGADVFADDFRT